MSTLMRVMVIVCGVFMLMTNVVFATTKSQVQAVCEISHISAPMEFTQGLEECSLSQAKEFYLLFSDAMQDVQVGYEFSVDISYDVGMCADMRWVLAKTKAGTIYCFVWCECTEYGNICHTECIYVP